ncbi:MAG: hypothetical protein ACREM3_25835 [Candidatus Rokuibacteriota bacterium]
MMGEKSFLMLSLAAGLMGPAPAHADVNVSINVATPAPPPLVMTTPQLVVVPGSTVYYAPGAAYNLFMFGGRYYSFHDGVWFYSATGRGKWMAVAPGRVPRPVIGVPLNYYKIPPGHAKKMVRDGAGREQGRGAGHPGKGKKGHDR